jgi:site-specific DNA-methyltransferase (adenine-specific)
VTQLVDKTCQETVWLTPPEILEPIRTYFDGAIMLDPATEQNNPTGAAYYLTTAGLENSWARYGDVFVNPPYGRDLSKWCEKIGNEARARAQIVALLPGQRFETRYVQEHLLIPELTALCFVRKRVRFLRKDGTRAPNNPYGSILWIFNGDFERAREKLVCVGKTVKVQV